MNYNLGLNLAKLEGFGMIDLNAGNGQMKKCIVIPVEDNHIKCTNSGAYLDIVLFENSKPSQYGDTHIAKRSLDKEEREHEKATGQRIETPIIGNLKPFMQEPPTAANYSVPGQTPASGYAPSAPAPTTAPAYGNTGGYNPNPVQPTQTMPQDNDLTF